MNTDTATATTPVDAAAARAAERAELMAKLAALEAQEKAEKEKMIAELSVKIDGLPALLGVKSFDEVVILIRQRQKNQLGAISNAANEAVRSRTVLSPEQRKTVADRLKAGGPGNQRSELAKEFNVSPGTLQNIALEFGLVKSRAAATEPAPATATA